ncbi:MAG TPA: peptide chain release factor N(5)-glutamine methyltransferase [Pseudomonadales bacterium]|nr:peptide chain release factor N(5)-glutamine methyltransferase [Pseudomonadales bacterium]
MTTIRQWLNGARDETSRRDAEVLIAHALDSTRAYLYAHADDVLAEAAEARIRELLAARGRGEPVAYLIGDREFWNLRLTLTPAVLIPRPETELLVELALKRMPRGARVVDLGTGSGAIALAIKSERADCTVVATDLSEAALDVARANALALGLQIDMRRGDWYAALDDTPPTTADGSERAFHVIVSNPPYVATNDPHLESLVSEPELALVGGPDGLAAQRTIIAGAPLRLAGGGTLLVEHGYDQGSAVRDLFAAAGFAAIETHRDGAGHERVTLGTR